MRRYWIDQKLSVGSQIRISGDLFKHIFGVCRQQEGSTFELLNGSDKAYQVTVESIERKEATANILSERVLPLSPKPHLVLCLSLPKLNKVDEILQKSVELGVDQVHLFTSEFSFLQNTSKIGENRIHRWQKIIQGALQQSGRGPRLQLHSPQPLNLLLNEFNRKPKVAGLFPYEGESKVSFGAALGEIKSQEVEEVWYFVGSEGGFSAAEVQLFRGVGLEPVSLGEQVLRVETACTVLAGILKYELHLNLE